MKKKDIIKILEYITLCDRVLSVNLERMTQILTEATTIKPYHVASLHFIGLHHSLIGLLNNSLTLNTKKAYEQAYEGLTIYINESIIGMKDVIKTNDDDYKIFLIKAYEALDILKRYIDKKGDENNED